MSLSETSLRKLAMFTIVDEIDGRIITSAGGDFDTTSYSRFKYGDTFVADRYGQLLAGVILNSRIIHNPYKVILTASAYKTLPTAAQAIVDSVSRTLHGYGYPVDGRGRIHREQLTEGDYATMTMDERYYWMSHNGLTVDPDRFNGRHVVVIDDISITGAHAESVQKMFGQMDVESVTFVNVLQLSAELRSRDPRIEDRLNHAYIKTLSDLESLISERSCWAPNARTVKFILGHSPQDILSLLGRLPVRLIEFLHEGIVADGYSKMNCYAEGADTIRRYLQSQGALRKPTLAL